METLSAKSWRGLCTNNFGRSYQLQRRSEVWPAHNVCLFQLMSNQKRAPEVFLQQACNFIKKRLQHRCFPVNSAKFLRTPILKNSGCFYIFKSSWLAALKNFQNIIRWSLITSSSGQSS